MSIWRWDDFNPRSREGSDYYNMALQQYNSISIHAPARGATRRTYPQLSELIDFNPRSREGSDTGSLLFYAVKGNFNPRSREGSDPRQEIPEQPRVEISIHAPARGATDLLHLSGDGLLFQSTLPRGERPLTIYINWHRILYFNPRSREGSDSPSSLALP